MPTYTLFVATIIRSGYVPRLLNRMLNGTLAVLEWPRLAVYQWRWYLYCKVTLVFFGRFGTRQYPVAVRPTVTVLVAGLQRMFAAKTTCRA